jgi:hypothetical protein
MGTTVGNQHVLNYISRILLNRVGTAQITPPLPGKPKTRPCTGIFVSSILRLMSGMPAKGDVELILA